MRAILLCALSRNLGDSVKAAGGALTAAGLKEYRKERAAGTPAGVALNVARYRTKDWGFELEDGRDGFPGATFKRDGFTINARYSEEEYPDISYLGEFTNKPGRGAFKRPNAGRGKFAYFLPAMTAEDTGSPDSPRRDWKRAESFGDSWTVLILTVAASRAGVELSREHLGGIESDSDRSYLKESISELADEAILEARAALESLCGASE